MYVDYVGIRVTRLAASVRFFTRGLGLAELRRGTMDHGGVWVLMQDPISQQRIELNWYPKGSKYYAEFVPGEGLDHLGFRVGNIGRAPSCARPAPNWSTRSRSAGRSCSPTTRGRTVSGSS